MLYYQDWTDYSDFDEIAGGFVNDNSSEAWICFPSRFSWRVFFCLRFFLEIHYDQGRKGPERLKMHEVRVYDNSGKLKKVISVKELNKRAELQVQSPALFKKSRPTAKTETLVKKVAKS